MRLTKEERVKIVELHYQNNGSVAIVCREITGEYLVMKQVLGRSA